ncbi:sulfatase-like hydrolase/transferase [Haloferula sp.]|uniref:sulfatase-like hydrolase/transferase n=1 Tax=Haloferula sp. TaxID=2497595 RepID=UPI003C70C26C
MKILLCLLALATPLLAGEKPNFVWIVSEDNSSHWLGCYGNKQAETPCLDALAKEGFLFEHAYSNAPVCAVARATILTGAYSPSMGTQHMRSRHPIPQKYRPNVEYLRADGYYCTNRAKTDYNFEGDDNSYWDDSSHKAHYKNRPEGKPFFAIFCVAVSHESSLFDDKPTEPKRLIPEQVDLPPYLPDLPEIRKDYARYIDRIAEMDSQVGKILEELKNAGLADNTIVIYSSDHGGILPRGKRYLEETGVKIPLIVQIPKRFRSLSPFKAGERVVEPVSFVDFSPTFLSLADIETPKQMQGRAFLGTKRVEPEEDEMEFLFADRFDELYGLRRGLTDGRWKYIRNFNPHFPAAPYSSYQFRQPGWIAYRKAWEEHKLSGIHKALWEPTGTSEQLYDLATDPWEVNNLAADPQYMRKLIALRERLKATMKEVQDTGLIPEPLFGTLSKGTTIADYVQSDQFDVSKVTDLAFTATEVDAVNIPTLKEALTSEDVVVRYWGIIGLRALGDQAAHEADALVPLLKDQHAVIRTTAADAIFAFGNEDLAANSLVTDVASEMDGPSLLNLLNTLRSLDLLDQLPDNWAAGKEMKSEDFNYIRRFAESSNNAKTASRGDHRE